MPWPSRPILCSTLPHPVIASAARPATAQAIAALRGRRGLMRRRSLTPGLGCGSLRVEAEPGRLQLLVAGDGGAREGLRRRLLEDHPETLQRALRVALDPAANAELLLEPLPRRAGLAPDRQVHARDAAAGVL